MAILIAASQLCGFLVDFWTIVISWFNSNFSNYAWSIILLTIAIKLVMTPLDFLNKKITRKNSKMQATLKPELEKLQQKYGHDRALYNQKMAELYKSNNYNILGSCLFMLVNMALTLTIFISLWSGLNAMASTKIGEQYIELQDTYQTAYTEEVGDETEKISAANIAVRDKYGEIKYSWLWIDNIWKADSPFVNSIPTFDDYLNSVTNVKFFDGTIVDKNTLDDTQRTTLQVEYESIMDPLRNSVGKTNGYLILLVCIVGTSFLSQWLMMRKNKMKSLNGQDPAASTGKIMLIILPIMLGFFALSYNAVFALYLLTSQIIAIGTTPLIDLLIDKLENKKQLKKEQLTVASYDRNKTIKNIDFTKTAPYDRKNTKNFGKNQLASYDRNNIKKKDDKKE